MPLQLTGSENRMLDTRERIAAGLQLLHGGDVVEIRALKVGEFGSTMSGYFDDYSLAAEAAMWLEAEGAGGIYTLINKVHPGCLARSPNFLTQRAPKTTTETDIIKVQWMLVDLDPDRPSGISATQDELNKAKKASRIVYEMAGDMFGYDRLIRACSGNGWHVLIPIDEDADTKYNKSVLKLFQQELRYIEGITVDGSVTKKNQLTKLYGTKACKGWTTPDRPHRGSYILTPDLETYNV